jgi:hypothetical protein
MNIYRITVRDKKGRLSAREKKAANLRLAAEGQDELAKIVKVERIHPTRGKYLVGFTTSDGILGWRSHG